MFKLIISCFLVFAIIFSLFSVYAFADSGIWSTLGNCWDAVLGQLDDRCLYWEIDADHDFKPDKDFYGCTVAADGKHILSLNDEPLAPSLVLVGDCKLCHQGLGQIVAYDKEHGGEVPTYNDYIADNYPANMYSSDGQYLFQLTSSMLVSGKLYSASFFPFPSSGTVIYNEKSFYGVITFLEAFNNGILISANQYGSLGIDRTLPCRCSFFLEFLILEHIVFTLMVLLPLVRVSIIILSVLIPI